jgi:hypothetical protein
MHYNFVTISKSQNLTVKIYGSVHHKENDRSISDFINGRRR